MDNLQKEITGYWFDLKSVMEHPVEMFDFFDFSAQELESAVSELYSAVEEGIIEYKNNIINSVFNITESLKYDTASLNRLEEAVRALKSLTYIILLQRLISKNTVKLKHRTEKPGEEEDPESPKVSISDIGNIIKEVQELLLKNPGIRSDKNIQNILIQINKYRTENDSMKKLINNIPKDKLENFKANYSKNINTILGSLINSYNQFLKEKEGVPSHKPTNPLELHDLTIVSEILKKQGEEIAELKSTLEYAKKERFQIRDIIIAADSKKSELSGMVVEEKKKYFNMALSEHGARELSRNFALEIIENLKKEIENL